MHVDLCFDHYFNCLTVKTDINKNGLNLIYSEGSKAFKTQIAAAWLAVWLNHSNFDVIWTAFQGILKLRTHISVFWCFWRVRAQNENPETTENHCFLVIKLKYMWICLMINILTFWVSKMTLAKMNSINLERSEAKIKLKFQVTFVFSFVRPQSINCLVRISFVLKNGVDGRAEVKKFGFFNKKHTYCQSVT